MFQGKTLEQLASEVTRQKQVKQDFIADTRNMSVIVGSEEFTLQTEAGDYAVNDHASKQIATRLEIPSRHFERLKTRHPDLLENTVNTLFTREPQSRMIRTLDGNARAFLSNRYKRLDNYEILSTALETLGNMDTEMTVASCEVTDTRMYLKAVFPRMEGEVKVGDAVQSGLQITNSEVGNGSVNIVPFINRLVCLNGMTSATKGNSYSRTHLGAKQSDTLHYQQDTLDADTRAILLTMRDHIAAVSSPEAFQQILEQMQQTTANRITGNPAKAVEMLGDTLKLTEQEQGNVLTSLIEGADLSQWGLLNAVTDASKKAGDYTRASDMEALGGKVLELNATQWRNIAEAA